MQIYELFSIGQLNEMIDKGYVKATNHPNGWLTILNYTPSAQYEKVWNDVTVKCRGLIYNHITGEVVARPFDKFFNYEEVADKLPNEPYQVFDKMDGSLGILYWDGFSWAIATRGSFLSEQACHATALLIDKYRQFLPHPSLTYLFEIIYPSNRIVVNYKGLDDLVLIDVIHTDSGTSVFDHAKHAWPGRVVEEIEPLDFTTLKTMPRQNAEGFVLKFDSGLRVKVKHDEYVRIHRIVTNVNAKTIWRYLADGLPFSELLTNVPDEFYDWVQATHAELVAAYKEVERVIEVEFVDAVLLAQWALRTEYEDEDIPLRDPRFRKMFARYVGRQPAWLRGLLFSRLENKDRRAAIWKHLKPTATRPFMRQSEDAN